MASLVTLGGVLENRRTWFVAETARVGLIAAAALAMGQAAIGAFGAASLAAIVPLALRPSNLQASGNAA
jgi:hypothetical protein